METSRVALIALVCVVFSSQKRISGAEVELRVRRGDDVTLYSDCVWKSGLDVVWFKHCSYRDHLPLSMSAADLMRDAFSRYSSVQNKTKNTHDLQIKKVTESDMGLYYCAVIEKKLTGAQEFRYGNRSTQLSLLAEPCGSVCEPCVSEWSVSWKLLFSVCAVCVLLSSLLSSICVYCLCTNTTKAGVQPDQGRNDKKRIQRSDMDEGEEVCYASLDVKKKESKKRVQHSDFSTYSEVRTEREKAAEEE